MKHEQGVESWDYKEQIQLVVKAEIEFGAFRSQVRRSICSALGGP